MGKGWLNNKTVLVVISVAIAAIMWFFVVTTEDPPRTEKVENVEIICGLNQYQINEGMSIISKSSETISFDANGNRSLVTGVKGSYYAKLNLDHISQPGKYTVTPEISKPDGVYISDIEPSVVEVYVDKYVSSLVPVQIKQTGTAPDGIVVKSAESDVKQIAINLPSLMLEQISYASAEVDVSKITTSASVSCVLELYDSEDVQIDMKNIVMEQKNISVDVAVEKRKKVSVYPDIRGENVDMSVFELQFSPVTVDVYGDVEDIDAVENLATEPIVFWNAPVVGEEYKTNIILPPGIYLKEDASDVVTVVFKNKH